MSFSFLIRYFVFCLIFRHLGQEREFVSSHEYIPITELTKGKITLPEFCIKAKEATSNETNSNTHNEPPSLKFSEY